MLMFCKEPPTWEELPKFLEQLTNPRNRLQEFIDHIEAVVLHIHLRDFLYAVLYSSLFSCLLTSNHSIMPPGQIHGVFTPVGSFCQGGHFFNLDIMHLTELSRFADVSMGNFITNQAHRGTLNTLCRIVLTLPFLPKTHSKHFCHGKTAPKHIFKALQAFFDCLMRYGPLPPEVYCSKYSGATVPFLGACQGDRPGCPYTFRVKHL